MRTIQLADAVNSLRPGAQTKIVGDVIEWLDDTVPPSKAELEAEIVRLQQLEPIRVAKQNRQVAYASEADPLFFKAQRGEATVEEWKAKIEEIKARFPYSEE